MEVAAGLSSRNGEVLSLTVPQQSENAIDIFLLEQATKSRSDEIDVAVDDIYKSLSVTAQEVIDKLNEILKTDLPDGIQSLKAEDVTPEATAERIVQGATAFFDIFAKQNPELSGEELLNSFLKTIRSGIDSGYDEAVSTLEGIGAFEFDGVKAGVEKTKSLIEEKLLKYEKQKRIDLGLDPAPQVEDQAAKQARSAVLEQAGYALSITA